MRHGSLRWFFVCLGVGLTALSSSAGRLAGQEVLFDFGAEWRLFKGTVEPAELNPPSWRTAAFDDSTWTPAVTGIGYGDGDDVTVLDDMEDGYTTIYLRRRFTLADVGAVESLVLAVDYDDGFVCYVNGTEAARANAGSPGVDLAFDATAEVNHEAGVPELFELPLDVLDLVAGENLIAIQGLNTAIGSSDFSFNARLTLNDPTPTCPIDLGCETLPASILLTWTAPPGASYDSVTVTRDGQPLPGSPFPGTTASVEDTNPDDFIHDYEVVASVGAFDCPVLTCSSTPTVVLLDAGEEWRFLRGIAAPSEPPTAWRETGFDDSLWPAGPTGIGYGDGDDATVLDDMEGNYLTVYARRLVEITDPGSIQTLVLEVDYDDGFVAYVNGTEVARSTNMGAPGTELAFDDPAGGGHEAGTPEQFSIPLETIVEGPNLLAVEIHNVDIDSSDLSFIPRLLKNACPTIDGVACAFDETTGEVVLSWLRTADFESIAVTRNGEPLPGSPFPGDTTTVTDAAPGERDVVYEILPALGALACFATTCTSPCQDRDPDLLACTLALVDGATRGELSWTTPPGVTSIDIEREGALLTTLAPDASTFIDPDVESDMPEDDTDFTVVFNFDDGSTCTLSCGPLSLCVENLACSLVGEGVDTEAELTWENVVKEWETIDVSRDTGFGAELLASLPGDATSFTDTTIGDLPPFTAVTYTLTPIAPPGEDVAGCGPLDCSVTIPLPEIGRYLPPEDGWNGSLDVEELAALEHNPTAGEPGNLDGDWIRAIGVDSWDGSAPLETGEAPDGAAPGGIGIETIEDGGPCGEPIRVLRVLDPGDPTTPGASLSTEFPDPYTEPNNRRILLGLDTGVAGANMLRDGVTIAARWRLGRQPPAFLAASAAGDGAPLLGGLGQIGFHFVDDGSLGTAGAPAGFALALNSGDALQLSTAPVTQVDVDADRFVSIWATVEDSDGDESYAVTVWVNGQSLPLIELVSPLQGGGADLGAPVGNYLMIGVPHPANDADVEIDFVAYRSGVHLPRLDPCEPSANNPPTARIAVSPGQTVTLAGGTASVTLDGSASDDGDGGAQGLAFRWRKVSGPAGDSIESPGQPSTRVTFTQAGAYAYELRVDDRQPVNNAATTRVDITVQPEGIAELFLRGDVDGGGGLAINDAIIIFNFLFTGIGLQPTCDDAADATDDGAINLTDGIRILNVLFQGIGAIPAPSDACGEDPTPDELDCGVHRSCAG